MAKIIRQATDIYEASLSRRFGKPRGAKEKDIAALEAALAFPIPKAYREFLLWMGKDTAGIYRGSEVFIEDIFSNLEFLRDYAEEQNLEVDFDRNVLCFFVHQGYMMAWFYVNEQDDDPEVYFYSESFETCEARFGGAYSEFLLTEMKGFASRN